MTHLSDTDLDKHAQQGDLSAVIAPGTLFAIAFSCLELLMKPSSACNRHRI